MANTGTKEVSIARIKSPKGWNEPAQTPEFDECTVVFKGELRIKTKEKTFSVKAGQSVIIPRNIWVQYSTPKATEYISVCLPAFSQDKVNRD